MIKDYKFYGMDEDIGKSLANYGLVVRNEKSDQYTCIYKNKENYDFSILCESELMDLIDLKSWLDKDKRDQFLNFCDQTVESFSKLPFIHKLFSMIHYFNVDDIMGTSYDPVTFKEALKLAKDI
jgi:hypothetical protein